jgi:lactoylglutathione lyase
VLKDPLFRKIDCLSLPVKDIEAALEFYHERLGLELVWRTDSAAGLRMADNDGELVLRVNDDPPETDLTVESAEDAARRFVEAGGTVVAGPFDIKIGKCVVVRDPWGNQLVLLDCTKGLLKTDAQGFVVE